MRGIYRSVSICLLLALFVFSGCGSAVSPPDDFDPALVFVTSDGETIVPRPLFLWDHSWTGDGWLAADGIPLIHLLPEIARELPVARYRDDFAVQYKDGVSFSHLSVFDDGFERLFHIFPDTDFSLLKELPKGTYYIGIAISESGDYIASEEEYEYHGYACSFKLLIE